MVPMITCYVFQLFLVKGLVEIQFVFAINDNRSFRAITKGKCRQEELSAGHPR